MCLKDPLPAKNFNASIAERYSDRGGSYCYLGFYDHMKGSPVQVEQRFSESAVGFFLDVAESLSSAKPIGESTTFVYPRCENRKLVELHFSRERSRCLAAACKQRDEYRCKVCSKTFAEQYGNDVGAGYAEAHHLTPLSRLGSHVKTKLEDLITVCANCHRMLHRMDGKPGDVAQLAAAYRRRRRAR